MPAPIVIVLALVVAGCVAPVPQPAPRVVSTPAPVTRPVTRPVPMTVAADWRDRPVTGGSWTYARDARGSVAMFGRVGADALAVLRCDRSGGRLFLSVQGEMPGALTVRTSSVERTLPLGATGGSPAYLAVTLTPTDPLLDAMAFSRGRFALSVADGPPLVLPAWAEVGRVVEDCRP